MSESSLEGTPFTPDTASLQGPVNSVMQTIFDEVGSEGVEEPTTDPGGVEPSAPAEPDAAPAGDGEAAQEPGVPTEAGGTEAGASGEPGLPTTEFQPRSAPVTADATEYSNQLNHLSDNLNDRFNTVYKQTAMEEARENYGHYVDRLELHPMELVGQPLPPLDGSEQDVVFNSVQDVKDWQDAVKTVLRREMQASISNMASHDADIREVLDSSIDLFRTNPDLIPGSKTYNKELAVQFTRMAAPYALRMDGKVTGYSIPVQGMVDQIRGSLAARKPAAAPAAKAPAKKVAAPPQGGLQSRAGVSGAGEEDFTPMWNALGIKDVPI